MLCQRSPLGKVSSLQVPPPFPSGVRDHMEFVVAVYGCPPKASKLDVSGIHHRASCLKFVRPGGLLKALIIIDEVVQELDRSIERVGTVCLD